MDNIAIVLRKLIVEHKNAGALTALEAATLIQGVTDIGNRLESRGERIKELEGEHMKMLALLNRVMKYIKFNTHLDYENRLMLDIDKTLREIHL